MTAQRTTTERRTSPTKEPTLVDRIIGNYELVFVLAALIATVLQIVVWERPLVESALLGLLVFVVGLQGLWAFLGHYFQSDDVAASIGWPAGNPFQKEIAFTNLAFGVLGVLCIWFQGDFWLAAGLGKGIFVLGAQTVHVREIREHGNRNPGNGWQFVLTNVILWAVILGLLTLYYT
jgi:hypothetical protein